MGGGGYPFGGSYNKDYNILGFYKGHPLFCEMPMLLGLGGV